MSSNSLADFRWQHSQPSDDQLLADAKCGNGRAFAELCQRYSAILRHRIFRIVRHWEDAEDVLQETFLSAFQHLDTFRGNCRFSTWLTRIGINASVMLLRKRKAMLKTASERYTDDALSSQMYDVPDYRPDPEEQCMWDETRLRLRAATQGLPPRLRSIIVAALFRKSKSDHFNATASDYAQAPAQLRC